MKEERAKEVKLVLSGLREEFKIVKSEIKKIYLQLSELSQLCFPKIDDLGFLNFLLENLKEILNMKLNSIVSIEHHVKIIFERLEFKSFLNYDTENQNEHDKLTNVWPDIIHISYQAENVIDSFVLGGKALRYPLLCLFDVMEEINIIKRKIMDIYEDKNYGTKLHRISQVSNHVAMQVNNSTNNEVVIGVRDEAEKIVD